MNGRHHQLVFGADIPPGSRVKVVTQTQVIFQPRRLVYKGPKDTFRLRSFEIGNQLQFFHASTPGISMDYFAPGESEELAYAAYLQGKPMPLGLQDALNNLGTCSVIQPAMNVTLQIECVASAPSYFEAVMIGEEIWRPRLSRLRTLSELMGNVAGPGDLDDEDWRG